SEQVGVTVVPEETGDQALSFRARSDLAPTQTTDASMTINGLSELTFRVSDVNDPVELTGETSYEIVVENIGSKEDRNVQVVVFLPPGLKFASAKGPTEHVQQPVENNYVAIQFQPIAKISPNDEAVFRIDVTGQAAGNHVIDVQVQSDERPNPVTKQESTRVFLDR
ncbi:MAG: hypothetical protein QF805_29855, partial [Pirellulaceae bacterium]|nr:hypothetical protein [Pirellulaceae bacterium]